MAQEVEELSVFVFVLVEVVPPTAISGAFLPPGFLIQTLPDVLGPILLVYQQVVFVTNFPH